ncbi:MAG TPA: zinc-ribbon domain-containing protein [Verrucomicrobiae bacterium]
MALIVGVPFVIFWIGTAHKAGAPAFFTYFGVMMLLFLVVAVIMGFYNSQAKNRISQYDITTPEEEKDPFTPPANASAPPIKEDSATARFCPACGARVQKDFQYCPKCGAKQPQT